MKNREQIEKMIKRYKEYKKMQDDKGRWEDYHESEGVIKALRWALSDYESDIILD